VVSCVLSIRQPTPATRASILPCRGAAPYEHVAPGSGLKRQQQAGRHPLSLAAAEPCMHNADATWCIEHICVVLCSAAMLQDSQCMKLICVKAKARLHAINALQRMPCKMTPLWS
jgi:hypothetical protein